MESEISKKAFIQSAISICILIIIIPIASYLILKSALGLDYSNDDIKFHTLIMLEALGYSLLIICIVFVYQYTLKKNLLVTLKKQNIYLLLCGGALLCFLIDCIRTALYDDSLGSVSEINISGSISLYTLFITVVFEELLFRKYLVDLGKGLGLNLIVSCIVSAILFALWHTVSIEHSWHLIFSGLLYSYFTYRFNSISFSVGLHFMYNLLVVFGNSNEQQAFMEDAYEYISPATVYLSIKFDLSTLALFLILDSIRNKLLGKYQEVKSERCT